MGNFLILLGLLIICSVPVHASELLGNISTDPSAFISDVTTAPPLTSGSTISPAVKQSSDCTTPGVEGCPASVAQKPDKTLSPQITETPAKAEKVSKILGQKIFADNSLVRDEQNRIWLIQGKVKKPIHSLFELAKYRGQVHIRARTEDLNQFQVREHLTGELIRQKNDVKVFVLKKEGKRHILNLAELARDYFGLTIYNLDPEEMKLY